MVTNLSAKTSKRADHPIILVTGGSGFIGKYTIVELIRCGFKVRAVGRTSIETKLPNLEYVFVDLNEPLPKKTFDNVGVIIHLAGIISGAGEKVRAANIKFMKNLLASCDPKKIKRFIFVSSSKVGLVDDEYAQSKKQAEDLLKKSSLHWVIFRPGMVYGPGDQKNLGMVISFAKRFGIVPIIGNGNYRLQPVYVTDVVQALVATLETNKFNRQIILLASTRPYRFNEIVSTVFGVIGKKGKTVHIPLSIILLLTKFLRYFGFITTEQVRSSTCDTLVSHSSIWWKKLKISPTPLELGLKKTIKG